MKQQKIVTVNKRGDKLVGIKTVPQTTKHKLPTIVLVHGFGVTKQEGGMFDDISKYMTEHGFLTFRFDFSGCGESEGDYSLTSLTKLRNDLSSILDFVRNDNQVDRQSIGIHAQSLGTATTITLAPEVNAFVFTSSVSHPKESLAKFFGHSYDPDSVSSKKRSSGITTVIRPQFWKDFENHDLLASMSSFRSPVLFIHGKKDPITPVSEMEAYFKATNSPKKKIVLKDADHSLRPQRQTMTILATNWFKKYLTR